MAKLTVYSGGFMRSLFRNLGLLSVTFSLAAGAVVVDKPSMPEAMKYVDADTLLIFDLDNTIVMPAQTLGGEEWFDYLVGEYVKAGLKEKLTEKAALARAIERALVVWNNVMRVTTVVAVEEKAPGLIRARQDEGTKTLGLTARPSELKSVTHEQLGSIGIDLSRTAPSKEDFVFTADAEVTYERGILYAGALNNKGNVLAKFLERTKLTPKKIVFVDNKDKHVQNVQIVVDALKKSGKLGAEVEYVGVRLGASDEKIARFNPAVADLQLADFLKIMGDAEAEALLEGKK